MIESKHHLKSAALRRRVFIIIALALMIGLAITLSRPLGSQAAELPVLEGLTISDIQRPDSTLLFKPDARQVRTNRLLSASSEPTPAVIPAGTGLDKVSFLGIDLLSSVIAVADTNGDRLPDAMENFIASDDPDNEATSALAFSSKTGQYYLGVIAADGAKKQQGQIIVVNNSAGSYRGSKKSSFAIGKGTPVGMVVLDSPSGDILIVASLFFKDKILGVTADDSYTITAYLPAGNGIPDGSKQLNILAAGSKLGNNLINFGFGGLAVTKDGVLYANVAAKVAQGAGTMLTGAMLAFSDSNGDGIPDKPSVFAEVSSLDPNPMTASSIIVQDDKNGRRLLVYGVNDIIRQPNQIVTYLDGDNNLKADGVGKVFYTSTPQFQGNIGSFGDGTSAVTISHLDFADGQAFFAFNSFDAGGSTVIDAGIAMVRDQGDGSGNAAVRVFQAPKVGNIFSGITFVLGVPRNQDTVPPTVTISSPRPGDRLMADTMATVLFTSADNNGIISHNIAIAVDGKNFVSLASGLPANMQSFQFIVPSTAARNAAIRVQAVDVGGNIGSAVVSDLIIETDQIEPTVTVTAPKAKDKLKGGLDFTITFTSQDNVGVVSHDIDFSGDGGATFSPVTRGLGGNIQTFTVTIPNIKVKRGVIKVVAKDAAGNRGIGLSGVFKIKPEK